MGKAYSNDAARSCGCGDDHEVQLLKIRSTFRLRAIVIDSDAEVAVTSGAVGPAGLEPAT